MLLVSVAEVRDKGMGDRRREGFMRGSAMCFCQRPARLEAAIKYLRRAFFWHADWIALIQTGTTVSQYSYSQRNAGQAHLMFTPSKHHIMLSL